MLVGENYDFFVCLIDLIHRMDVAKNCNLLYLIHRMDVDENCDLL